MYIEKETKEYEKFSKYYLMRDQILATILRSNTFLPFGLEALKYPVIFTSNIPMGAPAATNGKYIFINTEDIFFKDINVNIINGLTFAYMHEIGHNIFNHKCRSIGKNKQLWNMACDFFLNLFLRNIEKENKEWDEQLNLISMNIDLYSDKVLFNEKFNGLIEEEIYAILQKDGSNTKKESQQSYKDFLNETGIPDDKNISDNSQIQITETQLKYDGKTYNKTDVEFPETEDPTGETKESEKTMDSGLAKMMFESRIMNRGFQSSSFEEFIKRMFSVKVPWDTILKDSILIELQKKDNINYSKPRISWLCNPTLPYLTNIEDEEVYGTLVLAIDESGSMSSTDIIKAVEIAEQSNSYYKNIYVLKHDTQVRWQKLYENKLSKEDLDELCIRRHRGGTSHRDVFNKILEFEKQNNAFVSLVLILTDMCSDLKESQKIMPNRIPRIYLKTANYEVEGIIGKVITIQ
jgi:hypothetical protein